MLKKIIYSLFIITLGAGFTASSIEAGFFSDLKDKFSGGNDLLKKAYDKAKGSAKTVFNNAKEVGGKLVVKVSDLGKFFVEKLGIYAPKAAKAGVEGLKFVGTGGKGLADYLYEHRETFEPLLIERLKQMEEPTTASIKEVLGIVIVEVPGVGPLLSSSGAVDMVIDKLAPLIFGKFIDLIENDLKTQSGGIDVVVSEESVIAE